jgi:outer membrane protein OmpA-like peptidoglycan-associated protein
MKKLFIPLILFIGISINATAQEKSTKELKGDKYAFRYSFEKAIDSYSRAKQLTPEGQRKLAESYYNLNQNIESEAAYSKLISAQTGLIPEDYYNYAMVLKTNGKYDEYSKWMDKFAEQKPGDLRAKDYMANKAGYANLSKDNGKYKINILNINTDADDFGTCYYKDKIVFSSSLSKPKMIVRKYNWTGKPFWDIVVSDVEDGQLKTAENFDRKLNGKFHDGPASFSNDGTFMAFTRNNYKDKTKDKVVELQIMFSNFTDGKWSKPEPFILNNPEYSIGHPCLTADGKTMYFTSDMPGGYGGSDIYKISKDGAETWGKPENLGNKINTEGDELFPFFEETSKVLYFASNGRFGLGGLDVFISPLNGSEFGTAVNAGSPLNTPYDDFAVIVNDKTNKGYFSSNRSGGSGGDDLYAFDLIKAPEISKKISGIAQDKNGIAIPKTFITLLDDKGKIIDTVTTKDDAAYTFVVESGKNFELIGEKEKYLDGDTTANTFGKELIVKANVVLLTEKEVIVEKIQEAADLGKILKLDPIYFDYGKYNIRPDAEIELAKIVKIMNENPTLVVELRSYTDCRASEVFNQELSDNRAKASADYIKQRITKPERVYGKGYGETKMVNGCNCEGNVVSTCPEEEHQKNRRTEFIVVKK